MASILATADLQPLQVGYYPRFLPELLDLDLFGFGPLWCGLQPGLTHLAMPS